MYLKVFFLYLIKVCFI